ncbi:CRISPR-associated protein Cas2 [Brucella anthropi]|nr:CRISPR-associated protein Cas2 [Brucella anthropi]
MKCYIISYDLRAPGRNYDDLYETIKGYNKWARINESVWAVVTTQSAKEIRENLANSLDSDDRIFVVKSGVEAAWRNSRCKNEWLKENL